MNFQDLANYAERILKELDNGTLDVRTAQVKINGVGKISNMYKSKLDYNIHKHKIDSINHFEEK